MMAFVYECKHFDATMFCLVAGVEVPEPQYTQPVLSRSADGVIVNGR